MPPRGSGERAPAAREDAAAAAWSRPAPHPLGWALQHRTTDRACSRRRQPGCLRHSAAATAGAARTPRRSSRTARLPVHSHSNDLTEGQVRGTQPERGAGISAKPQAAMCVLLCADQQASMSAQKCRPADRLGWEARRIRDARRQGEPQKSRSGCRRLHDTAAPPLPAQQGRSQQSPAEKSSKLDLNLSQPMDSWMAVDVVLLT
eukprot:scaffold12001_cov116-Isochrysis_galbana.AAC.21